MYDTIKRSGRLVVTDEHIKLVRSMRFRWDGCEFGAVAVDSKRPYGNSDVLGDIAEMVGVAPRDEDADEWPDGVEDWLRALHAGACIALEIAAHTGALQPGAYVRDARTYRWRAAA